MVGPTDYVTKQIELFGDLRERARRPCSSRRQTHISIDGAGKVSHEEKVELNLLDAAEAVEFAWYSSSTNTILRADEGTLPLVTPPICPRTSVL